MDPSPSKPATLPQVLLGWFVLGQLLFLIATNAVFLIRPAPAGDATARPGPFAFDGVEAIRKTTQVWADVTLQQQYWGLFPHVPDNSRFPAVRLVWNDTRAGSSATSHLVLSPFEPADPDHYFYPNLQRDRHYNFEAWLGVTYLPWDDQKLPQEPAVYQHYRAGRTRAWGPTMRAYMELAWRSYQREHPDAKQPDEIILLFREYPTPPPGADLHHVRTPAERNLVRRLPGATLPPDELPLQVYDPHRREFVPVKAQP